MAEKLEVRVLWWNGHEDLHTVLVVVPVTKDQAGIQAIKDLLVREVMSAIVVVGLGTGLEIALN